jgi:hypothetical protein
MKLNTKCDIDAPYAFVFSTLADFESWERLAIRHGAEVERSNPSQGAAEGASWRVRFPFRGKMRDLLIRLVTIKKDEDLAFTLTGAALDGNTSLELVPLSLRRTRLNISLTIRPKTLAARLFLHSLKLARRRVTRRLDNRVQQLRVAIEGQYRQSQLEAAPSRA